MDSSPDPSEAPQDPRTLPLAPEAQAAAEALAARAALRRRRALLIVLGIVVLLGGLLGARPAWRRLKAWRAENLAAEGEALLALGRHEGALDKAKAALQIAPANPRALRLGVGAAMGLGSPFALHFAQRLAYTPDVTVPDRQELARLAMSFENLRLASNTLAGLVAVSNPPPRTLQLAAQYHLLAGDLANAIRYGRELASIDGANPTNLLGLASALALTRQPTNRDEARRLLWKAVELAPDKSRTSALEGLVLQNLATSDDFRRIVELLQPKPSRNLRENILLADALLGLSTNSRIPALEAVLPSLEAVDLPVEDVLRGAAFLARQREYRLLLRLLPPARAATNAAYFRARLTALVESGAADKAYTDALSPPNPKWFDPLDLEILRYRIARSATNGPLAEEHAERFVSVAGRDARRLRRLVAYAENENLDAVALDASRVWSQLPNEETEALPHLLRAMDRLGDTDGARGVARRLAELIPGQPAHALRAAHLDALLGDRLEASLRVAQGQFDDPELALHARATAALAFLRLGQATNAAQCLLVRVSPELRIPPSYQAISVAVNAALGRTQMAQLIARGIPLASLRPEEKGLVRPSLPPPLPLAAPAASAAGTSNAPPRSAPGSQGG